MRRGLYWFRNDLRLHDNIGLSQLINEVDELLPVYCIEPDWFKPLNWPGLDGSFPKMGKHRARFLIECLTDLKAKLQAMGSDLLICTGKPSEVIPDLCREFDIASVSGAKLITYEEVSEEQTLKAKLTPHNIKLNLSWQTTVLEPDSLPFPIGKLPGSFTSFRHKVEKRATVRNSLSPPTELPKPPSGADFPEPPSLPGLASPSENQATAACYLLKGGETAGLERLNYYLWESESVANYKQTRNELIGLDYSTKFSIYLAQGCLSPREIFKQLKYYEQKRTENESTYWVWFELLWRDYYHFLFLKYGNRLFRANGVSQKHHSWNHSKDSFERWCNGQTGYPLVDASMRELNTTGYTSNRARQNAASFLSKQLKIDWRWGAAYYESQLLDYDVCSNWGNWAYQAGVGTDPRDRVFNVTKQAHDYDANANYIRLWLPELKNLPPKQAIEPWKLTDMERQLWQVETLPKHYCSPIC